MPIIRENDSRIKFHIVGSNMPDEVKVLEDEDIVVHGFIDDLDEFLSKMKVSIAPLRFGAGIKGKIGTAMASGLPVVASTIAAEGMKLSHQSNVLIADSPDEFANSVLSLYNDDKIWTLISKNGLEFAENEWGSEVSTKRLLSILHDLGIKCNFPPQTPKLYSYN